MKTITDKDTDERAAIKRVLNQLALSEMLEAVQQCDELAKLDQLPAFAQSVPSSTSSRTGSSRPWKDARRDAQGRVESSAEMKKRPGGNLPDDVKKKLRRTRTSSTSS